MDNSTKLVEAPANWPHTQMMDRPATTTTPDTTPLEPTPGHPTPPHPIPEPARPCAPTGRNLRFRSPRALLVRPRGQVQIGWNPETAVVVTPPPGVTQSALLQFLDLLDGSHNRQVVLERARDRGMPTESANALLDELIARQLLHSDTPAPPPPSGGPTTGHQQTLITLIGRGPLADLLAQSLPGLGVRVRRRAGGTAGVSDRDSLPGHLVVLADSAIVDPRLALLLVRTGIPHLPVSVREGVGVIGPMVLPGLSSCLYCTHLYRCDRDPDWPYLAAQLTGKTGAASHATTVTTSGIALAQIEIFVAALNAPRSEEIPPPPAVLFQSIEVDAERAVVSARSWPRHQRCECWQVQAERPRPLRHAIENPG